MLTFQIEQIEQKTEKRHRTKEYRIVEGFAGSWFPFWYPFHQLLLFPLLFQKARLLSK